MLKQEEGTNYQWREYMLLLKDRSTRQLAEYNGHWMWIGPAAGSKTITVSGDIATHKETDEAYALYARYKPELLLVMGEFDWNIFDDQSLTISEYINPPRMLVNEKNDRQNDWYLAEYVDKKDMVEAFGIKPDSLPRTYGIGAIQPNEYTPRWTSVLRLSLLALIAAILIHLINITFRPSGTVLKESLSTVRQFPDASASPAYDPIQRAIDSARIAQTQPTPKMVRSRSFTIDGPTALNISFNADVDNTWIEFGTELVNEQTNQRYIFTEAVEYYHGNSGGESWTEGGTENSATLSKIPSGQYHLEITPYTQYGQQLAFSVVVAQNTSLISNVFLMMALLAAYPLYVLFRRSGIEKQRWSQSDFGPDEE
jgi:hypothetical protein